MVQESAIDSGRREIEYSRHHVCVRPPEAASAAGADTVEQNMVFYRGKINDTQVYYELFLFLKDLVPHSVQTVVALSVVYDQISICQSC